MNKFISALVGVVLAVSQVGAAWAGATVPAYTPYTSPGVMGYPLVSNRGTISNSNFSNGTDLKTSTRVRFYIPNATSDLRLVYSNFADNGAGAENLATTSITVSGAIEYPQGTVNPVTWGGQATITIPPNTNAPPSDPVAIDVPAGSVVWARSAVAQSGGTIWPLHYQAIYVGTNAGQDGDSYGLSVADATNATPIVIQSSSNHNATTGDQVTISGSAGNTAANGTWTITVVDATHFSLNTSVGNGAYTGGGQIIGTDQTKLGSGVMRGNGGFPIFGPTAILGALPKGKVAPYVVTFGDSIDNGTGDTTGGWNNGGGGGWVIRGIGGNNTGPFPYMNLSTPGSRVSQFAPTSTIPTNSLRRRQLGMGAPYVVDQFGTNDYSNSVSLAQLQSYQVALCTSVSQRGGRCIVATLLPKTTSTDSWATATNQTPAANDSERIAYNDWLRCGAPLSAGVAVACNTAGALLAGQYGHPFWTTIDPAALVEANASNVLTIDGGRWLATGSANGPTTDGTHPTSAYHALAAGALTAINSQMVAF